MKIEIKSRFTGAVLFTHAADNNSLRVTLQAAVAVKTYLRGADLRGADLSGADLSGAYLSHADLRGVYLSGANLRGADLSGIPSVPNIDAAILAAIENGGKLDMDHWHSCATTHCRAGWAITLAGEAGLKLETAIGPAAAGALIYAKSRPEQPLPNFYATDDETMADLRACAALLP